MKAKAVSRVHDLVFVATEDDRVCPFDAAGQPREPVWHRQLARDDETAVPARDVQCPFAPEVGITPTPVIDAPSGTLDVLARTKLRLADGKFRYVQRLHVIDVRTGADTLGGPIEIAASMRGSGTGSSNGMVAFDPLAELPRAGLRRTRAAASTWPRATAASTPDRAAATTMRRT